MKDRGFTLVEIMIVVAILAILALAATAAFGDAIKKTKDGRVISLLGTLRSGAIAEIDENKHKVFPEKIRDIKIVMTPQMDKISGDGDIEVSDTDSITSIEVEAGTAEKNGVASTGRIGGKFEGKQNIVEIFYENDGGTLVIDGAGASSDKEIKEYNDSKKKYWKIY